MWAICASICFETMSAPSSLVRSHVCTQRRQSYPQHSEDQSKRRCQNDNEPFRNVLHNREDKKHLLQKTSVFTSFHCCIMIVRAPSLIFKPVIRPSVGILHDHVYRVQSVLLFLQKHVGPESAPQCSCGRSRSRYAAGSLGKKKPNSSASIYMRAYWTGILTLDIEV